MHRAMRHLVTFDAADGEDTALLNFAQERSFFAQRAVTVTRSTTSYTSSASWVDAVSDQV